MSFFFLFNDLKTLTMQETNVLRSKFKVTSNKKKYNENKDSKILIKINSSKANTLCQAASYYHACLNVINVQSHMPHLLCSQDRHLVGSACIVGLCLKKKKVKKK